MRLRLASTVRSAAVGALLLAAMLALGACETVVDVAPPPHEARLVAQGFFTADSLWVVRVTHTVGFTNEAGPGPVDSAEVEIREGGRLLARLQRRDAGTYAAVGERPERGRIYELRVSAPGYPEVEGRDALPPPVPVVDFRETVLQSGAGTASRRRVVRVDLTLDDPAGEANFYGLLVLQARWQEDRGAGSVKLLPPSLFGFESDDPALGESPFGFLDTEKTYYREAFFPDDRFDGRAHTLDFEIQYDEPPPDAGVVVRRAFAVLVLSVSGHFYRYWTTAGGQFFANENPFAEPLRVHSNLRGGPGVFAGFQYRFLPLSPDTAGLGALTPSGLCPAAAPRPPVCDLLFPVPPAGP